MKKIRRVMGCVLLASVVVGAGPATSTTGPVKGDEMLAYLDHVIDWYRRVDLAGKDEESSQAAVLQEGVRVNARKVVSLGFDFARAEAAMIEASAPVTQPVSGSKGKNLAQVAASKESRLKQLQADAQRINDEIAHGAASTRPAIVSEKERLAAQLRLAAAQRDVMQKYAEFVASAENGDTTGSLTRRINDLEKTLPEIRKKPASTQQNVATPTTPPAEFHAENAGVVQLLGRIFALSGRLSELKGLAADAQRIHDECERFRAPIRTQILAAVREGDAAEGSNNADVQKLNQLSERFNELAAAGVPLGEQEVLLETTRQQILNWRAALTKEYSAVLKYLLIRVVAMGIVILVLIAGSELWRRATYRYVKDARRRRVLMLVRRIVVAGIVVVIIAAGVMTEFGSLATFAGLITAGIAVALQAVILSGVAYFFFIGRFGVRIGDRVTISGITGDVIEIGILRLYMAELAGKPTDLHPTGRIVVFSNSVLFQPSAFYKQIPGANYVWHEVGFILSPGADVAVAEKVLVNTVKQVYQGWKSKIDRGQVEANMKVEEGDLLPEGRLRMTDAGLELVVRYPVEIRLAAEEDDHVMRGLMQAIEEEPKLKLAPGGRVIQPAETQDAAKASR